MQTVINNVLVAIKHYNLIYINIYQLPSRLPDNEPTGKLFISPLQLVVLISPSARLSVGRPIGHTTSLTAYLVLPG